MTERKDPQYEANVLAHIEMHKTNGETKAVEGHMASPAHKAIVEAADSVADAKKPKKDGPKRK